MFKGILFTLITGAHSGQGYIETKETFATMADCFAFYDERFERTADKPFMNFYDSKDRGMKYQTGFGSAVAFCVKVD